MKRSFFHGVVWNDLQQCSKAAKAPSRSSLTFKKILDYQNCLPFLTTEFKMEHKWNKLRYLMRWTLTNGPKIIFTGSKYPKSCSVSKMRLVPSTSPFSAAVFNILQLLFTKVSGFSFTPCFWWYSEINWMASENNVFNYMPTDTIYIRKSAYALYLPIYHAWPSNRPNL